MLSKQEHLDVLIPTKSPFLLQDDAANDPQWSEEQLIEVKFKLAGLEIGKTEVDIMAQSTRAIFEILEKAWQPQNCTLVDLKVDIHLYFRSWLLFFKVRNEIN